MKTLCNRLLTLSAIVLLFATQACKTGCIQGSGKEATDKRQVTAFDKLDIAGSFNITLMQDSSNSITINADDNILSIIKTNVSGDKLKISTDNKNICSSKEVTITIGVRNLKSIAASGAVEITSNGRLNLGDLDLNLSGATKINLDIVADNVETNGSGASDITLKGQASSHSMALSGNGKLHAFDFVTSKYIIENTGESDLEINVLTELNVDATGSCDVKYKGNPSKIHKNEMGSLSLTKVE